jgi:hypothetical protein
LEAATKSDRCRLGFIQEDIMNKTHPSLVAALLGLTAILTVGCGDSGGPAEPTTGTLEITVSTDSANVAVDPGGYTLVIDGGAGQAVGANATVTITGLPTGPHLVRLDGVAPNYAVNGNNPRWAYVDTDKTPASPVSFSVSRFGTTDCRGCWDY